LFFLPRSLFFYICGGGLPEKRGQLLSLFPYLFLFQFSPSTLFDRGGEYHSINNKKKVAIPFQMV